MLDKMIRYRRSRGAKTMIGQIPSDHYRMLKHADGMGFKSRATPNEAAVEVTFILWKSASKLPAKSGVS